MLPSPDDLDRYTGHLPDAAERLLAAAEREQAHRHQVEHHLASMEQQSMPLDYTSQKRGHLITLALGLSYLAVMTSAIAAGHPLIGTGGAALGAAAFLWHTQSEVGDGS